MTLFEFLQLNPFALYLSALCLGLMVGSFLNVVINRLPLMMQREWQIQCAELQGLKPAEQEAFNLLVPRSRCPACGHSIKFYENIPVISYLFLRGRCANCKTPISKQYPLVEILSGVLSAGVVIHFGFTITALAALTLTWALIALCVIDIKHMLLPDNITQPILWLGLLLSLPGIFTTPVNSILGAATGYLAFWSVYQIFKRLTGKEGMGYGDFKLLGMAGAWLGWQYLPLIIFLSSLLGTIVGVSMILIKRLNRETQIPFGPYLAIASWIAMMWGQEISALWYKGMGLTH